MMPAMPRDTSTRFEGVYARHRQACAIETTGDCTCDPSYWGKAYDRGPRSLHAIPRRTLHA